MGEDVEGEVGEEAAGYAGDAEDDSDLEGGECSLFEWLLVGGADVLWCRGAMVVVGRSFRNDTAVFPYERFYLWNSMLTC